MQASLQLDALRLDVYLGWPAEERQQQQTVDVFIAIDFVRFPTACETDELDNTCCYDQLSQKLSALVVNREYRLIEHLAYELFRCVQQQLQPEDIITLRVCKNPPMDNLANASFIVTNKGG